MSVLLIDAGNSRLKWAQGDAHGVLATADAAQLAEVIAQPVQHAWISNVAGDATRAAITQALSPQMKQLHWVRAQAAQCGVTSGYANPAQLGSDRWCGLIAARRRHASTLLVVNAGTTVTIDALTASGEFLGGVIVPGLALMRESLACGTAQLQAPAGEFEAFPRNTANAIHSGALNACTGAIDRMGANLHAAGHGTPLIILSGGAAPVIKPALNVRCEVVDNLVLDGLLEISREALAR